MSRDLTLYLYKKKFFSIITNKKIYFLFSRIYYAFLKFAFFFFFNKKENRKAEIT